MTPNVGSGYRGFCLRCSLARLRLLSFRSTHLEHPEPLTKIDVVRISRNVTGDFAKA